MNIFVVFWFTWFIVSMFVGVLNFLGTPSWWHIKSNKEEDYYIKRHLYIITSILNMTLSLILILITYD